MFDLILSINKIYIIVGIMFVLGLFFGLLIAYLSDVLKVKEDERIEKVNKMLPGYNCGACGKSGCLGLAKSIVEEGESPNLCKPIKKDQLEELKKYLGNINNKSS